MMFVIYLIVGIFLGAGLVWFLEKTKRDLIIGDYENRLQTSASSHQKEISVLVDAEKKLSDTFKALSSETLQNNNKVFLDLAKSTLETFNQEAKGDLEKKQQAIEGMIKPVKDVLEKFDQKVNDLEKNRVGAYSGLTEQVKMLLEAQVQLKKETTNLAKALGTPQVRGKWGEIQLKRVVEMAGMLDHCDFYEQISTNSEDGRLRPDMVVKLPGDKTIVVDSKAVVAAYFEAAQAEDETVKRNKLQQHARHIKERVSELSKKSYWDQFANSPEFVVLFLPGENLFSSALEVEPALIELSVEQKVIIATPTTLIALLKAVAYGWKQVSLAANARDISDLGKELHKRVYDFVEHYQDVGDKLDKAVGSYNRSIGTLETRVLVTARKFKDLKSTGDEEIEIIAPLDKHARALQDISKWKLNRFFLICQ
jgi:DNA recombination protein RmuC